MKILVASILLSFALLAQLPKPGGSSVGGGGGGGGATNLSGLTDLKPVRTSGTVLTISAGMSRFGNTPYNIVEATATITAGSGSGTAKVFISPSGTVVVEHPTAAGLSLSCSNCSASQVVTPTVVDGAIPLANVTISAGNWDTVTDLRSMISTKPLVAGNGIVINDSLGEAEFEIDSAQVMQLSGTNIATGTYDFSAATVTGIGGGSTGYTLTAIANTNSPADATTYCFADWITAAPTTNCGYVRLYVPKTGQIKAVYGHFYTGGASGTSENSQVYIRLNNTTDIVTVTTTLTTNSVNNTFNATGLSASVTAGDYINVKWVTPTWGTNPTNIRNYTIIYIE